MADGRKVVVYVGNAWAFSDYLIDALASERSSAAVDVRRGIATTSSTTYIRVGWRGSQHRLRGMSGPAELVVGPGYSGSEPALDVFREYVGYMNSTVQDES